MITNFKIFENNRQNCDFVINKLIEDFENNNFENLKNILMEISRHLLIGSLPEEDWKKYTATNKELIVDIVIKDLKLGFEYDDYTVLDELLGYIPDNILLETIPEDWIIEMDSKKYNI